VTEYSPLQSELKKLLKSSGPMPVWRYMEMCLTHPQHGYYVSRDPLGREGDFITAPEVSQMFGWRMHCARCGCCRRCTRR
jgi:NADH dehydrogenase [ubiquinone] 1 alpha subcomplex assembly factor 7